MNVWWTRLGILGKSWHVLGSPTDTVAYCGRLVEPTRERFDNRPAGKTCETCLRVLASHTDPPEASSGAEVIVP